MQCWDDKASQEEAYLARELRVRCRHPQEISKPWCWGRGWWLRGVNDRSQRHSHLGLLGSLWSPSAEPQARILCNQSHCGGQGSQGEVAGGSLCLRLPWAEALAGAILTKAMAGHGTSDPGGAAGNGPKDCPGTGPEGC